MLELVGLRGLVLGPLLGSLCVYQFFPDKREDPVDLYLHALHIFDG